MAERIITASDRMNGASNPHAKLMPAQVVEIVRRVRAGETQSSVAKAFGVNKVCVSHIMRGKNWGHLTRTLREFTPNHGRPHGETQHAHRLTEAGVRDIVNRLSAGQSISSVARTYRVAFTTIQSIKRGNTWKHIPRPKEVSTHAA